MTKVKNSKCDNSETQNVTIIKNSKTQIEQNSKTQNEMKLKNLKCDKTQKVTTQKLKV